jgi:hypothetical protein
MFARGATVLDRENSDKFQKRTERLKYRAVN